MQQAIAAGMLLSVETVLLKELIQGVCGAGLGALAGAGLVATSFVAIEALMPASAAMAEPVYLRCDFKDWKKDRPSAGAVDLVLNESQSTVTSKIWDLGPGYASPAFFGPRFIEFQAVQEGGPSMLVDRKLGWLTNKGGSIDQNLQEAPCSRSPQVLSTIGRE